MRKSLSAKKWKLAVILALVLFFSSPYSIGFAHIFGTFGDFLQNYNDSDSILALREELNQTELELENLMPQVADMRQQYQEQSQQFEPMLQFYRTSATDTYIELLMNSEELIDVFAYQRLFQHKLEADVSMLESLYRVYLPLENAVNTTQDYQALLKLVESSLTKREQLQAKLANASDDEIDETLSRLWTQNIGYLLELRSDSKMIEKNPMDFIKQLTPTSPYRIEQDLINEQSKLRYFIRNDHVYAFFSRGEAEVILVGMIGKSNEEFIELDFEAGFINGFHIPYDWLELLKGFNISYRDIHGELNDFYVESTTRSIIVQPIENMME
ncbi:hypothetical protein ACE3MQ_12800 [Paenibacillus lentus]|uniref:hypothetical protein n=1 Tax=Paenibacillus lentus TaxID=1338368 RepID=UPI0036669377